LVKGYQVEGNLIYEERQLQQASAGLARRPAWVLAGGYGGKYEGGREAGRAL
jgi:hypothetical protein